MECVMNATEEVNDVYARTARQYDRLLGLMSLGSIGWQRRRLAARLPVRDDGVVVDLGCGTGGMSLCLQERFGRSGRLIAIDPCREMLEEAQRRGVEETLVGDLATIPLDDASADGLVCAYAIRYSHDLNATFGEMRRVLRPGSPVRILEMTAPKRQPSRAMAGLFINRIAPPTMALMCWNRSIGELMHHFWHSVSTFKRPDHVAEQMKVAGFSDVVVHGPWGMLTEWHARV